MISSYFLTFYNPPYFFIGIYSAINSFIHLKQEVNSRVMFFFHLINNTIIINKIVYCLQMRTRDNNRSKNKSSEKDQINKSVAGRINTSSKDPINSSNTQGQLLKKTKNIKNLDFVAYIDVMTDQLQYKKQKMQACINLFNLMHSNNMQLRCMQHNNILTLYCLTERKVLCVNCTYGLTKHRTHKVAPLKDSIDSVANDNQLLRGKIDNDLKVIEESLKNCQQNSYTLERQMKKVIDRIDQTYQRKIEEIKTKYFKDKAKIRDTFQTILSKTRNLQRNMQEFKFKIWQTLSKIGIGKRNQSTTYETEVIRQVFCANLSELTNFQVRQLTKRQLQRLSFTQE